MTNKTYCVTGVIHGSWVIANCAKKARKAFKNKYPNEKIISVHLQGYIPLNKFN